MATWKKLVVSGSGLEQLSNAVTQYITAAEVPGAVNSFATASINGVELLADSPSGSFSIVTGSAGTGLTITGNAGTDTISFDLSAIPNSTLANDGITIAGQDISLGGTITADTIAGQISAGTITNAQLVNDSITVGTTEIDLGASSTTLAGLTSVTSTGFTGSLSATSVLADGVTATTQTAGDNSTKVATTAYVDASVGNATLTISSSDGAGSSIAIDLNDEALTLTGNDGLEFNLSVNDAGIGIANGGINAVKLNSDVAGSGLTSTSGVLSLTDDSITFGSTAVALGDTVSQLSLTGFTGSFVGDVQGTASVASKTAGTLVDGNGIADFSFDGSGAASVAVELDGGTLSVGASGLKVADAGITATQLATSVAGDGLAGGAGTALSVNVDDSTIEIATDTLQVKNSGITNAKLANAGFDIAAGTNGTGATNEVSLGDTLTINGTSDEVDITIGTDSITVGLPQDVVIGQDLTVTRNLTVIGTASFQHETNLEVADRFIVLASGSADNGDGGIVIQQNSDGTGEVFGFDNPSKRFGVSGSFDAGTNSFTPDAFMAAVIEGIDENPNSGTFNTTKYDKKGNIFVQGDAEGSIWIYS